MLRSCVKTRQRRQSLVFRDGSISLAVESERMKNIAITGGARGIGLELVRQHLDAGDRVFAFVRDVSNADQLTALTDAYAEELSVHEMDVSDDSTVRAAAASIGDTVLDIVYNTAGLEGPNLPELERSDWAAWNQVFATNLQGPLRVLQAFLARLREGSKVMNFSSSIGTSTWPMGGHYAYGASKAALGRLMRGVAIDLKDRGIIIGIIHPGWVQTDMGGPYAPLAVEESVKGCRAIAAEWTPERSGDFIQWTGEPQPW
jgi:NAD(P)-dependent dehydrogenase (short-subunit alcohol dehydrogenase family)